ncbi:anti-phage dCTP deaminase [Pectobacterium versatile]|uniref:anti-phage dCTP deaminase n=1 Tax=Pectobacterium versatile TaxID=2488639 RepID=UPI0030172539
MSSQIDFSEQLGPNSSQDEEFVSPNSTYEATASVTPELVIALCGPIGSPLHETAEQIAHTLFDYGYTTSIIKLSDLIRLNANAVNMGVNEKTNFEKFKTLINIGDELRKKYGNDVLTKMAIAKISGDREKTFGQIADVANEGKSISKIKEHRLCHVIDSIKNKYELDLLKTIYGRMLYSIGVFSPLEIRRSNLEKDSFLSIDDIHKLVDTDSGEEFDHGQSVRDTFPKCDYFMRVDAGITEPTQGDAKAQILKSLERFFKLVFKTAVISPSSDENAMYAAASAARNSACLSRQVGAAVTSLEGVLLSTGWNDVPRSGGGLYGKPALDSLRIKSVELDSRCYSYNRICSNDAEKRKLAEIVIDNLIAKKLMIKKNRDNAVKLIITSSRLKDLIEFSRAIHAEMHAILSASRIAGDRIIGGKIFVTTYPCHSCARHIVAAGISEVYFIEPYRKSLATRLHDDTMTESIDLGSDKVRLIQFSGVAPSRFLELFESGSRKGDKGMLHLQKGSDAHPVSNVSLRAIPRLEEVVIAELGANGLNFMELSGKRAGNEKD